MASGLYKAPVTKLVLVGCCGFTVAVLSMNVGPVVSLGTASQVFSRGEWYRLFTSLAPCTTLAEGLFSWFLLYRFRAFERQMGSARFSMFLLLCTVWGIGSRAALLYLLPGLSAGLASGPYELLFALFVYFHRAIPKLQPSYFSICGLRFSDKSFTYLMGLQLLFNGGWTSLLPGLSGLTFGVIYMSDALRLQRLTWPRPVRAFFSRWVRPLLDPAPSSAGGGAGSGGGSGSDADGPASGAVSGGPASGRRRVPAAGGGGDAHDAAMRTILAQMGGGGGGGPYGGDTRGAGMPPTAPDADGGAGGGGDYEGQGAPPAALAADPAAVERVMAMGFERGAVEAALRRAFNDENAAVNRLLEGT